MLGVKINKEWAGIVDRFARSPEGKAVEELVLQEKESGAVICPPNPFRAFELTPPDKVKVVILGQDPYHGPNQANGLAFSVYAGEKVPPSLRNIYKELSSEYPGAVFSNGELENWAKQGVLLLNAVLTVRLGMAGSHAKKGWEKLTDEIIKELAEKESPTVFMLWGKFAQEKAPLIRKYGRNNLILESNHPSPLSATRGPVPFIGNGHFRKANEWLESKGVKPIDWIDTN